MNAKTFCVLCGCCVIVAVAAASSNNYSDAQPQDDHRLILTPGRWKVRSRDPPVYITYSFVLGLDISKQQVLYPTCVQIACHGRAERSGCSTPCLSEPWSQTDALRETTVDLYDRAAQSMVASFVDLAAIMDTHITSEPSDLPTGSRRASAEGGSYHARTIDVMAYYRAMMSQSLGEIKNLTRPVEALTAESHPANSTRLANALETWKSGVYALTIHLNSMISTARAAEQRLVLCSEGVARADLTGCEPHLSAKFHTDVPLASRSVSASSLTLLAMRRTWEPMLLSRWFMAFVDTSQNDRVCWLATSMVTDGTADYEMPHCDASGLCDPLQLDETTVLACTVDASGAVSSHCPLQCGAPCNGPVCYNSNTERYNILAWPVGPTTREHGFNLTAKPRSLVQAQSLTASDLGQTMAYVANMANETAGLLRRTRDVFGAVEETKTQSLAYMRKVNVDMLPVCDRVTEDYHRAFIRLQLLSYLSLVLSVIACPMLVIIFTKMRTSSDYTTSRRQTMEPLVTYHPRA